MKKVLALILCLLVSLSATAFAEAAYTYAEYSYDESMFADIDGEWIALEGLGLKFYLPDIYLAAEVTEDLAAAGVVGLFATEDSSSVLSVSYGPAVDAEGNAVASLEELAAYYTSVGATMVDISYINGIPLLMCMLEATDSVNYTVLFDDSTQCIFTFTPGSDMNNAVLAGLISTTVMVDE